MVVPAFHEIIFDLFPDVDAHRYGDRAAYIRGSSMRRIVDCLFPVDEVQDRADRKGHQKSENIHGVGHEHGILRKEHLRKQDVYGQAGRCSS